MEDTSQFEPMDPELTRLILNKQSGYNYRERREEDWRENYSLYRDKVVINRLTQRQSVNMPLMKTAMKTILKDIDDMPVIHFENLDNDKQKELFLNEYWKLTLDMNRAELFDIIDKKQEGLFGRSFDQMQIADGMVQMTIQDPQDILVDRYMDPSNIDSSRFLIHTHIFKALSKVEENEMYDKKALVELREWHGTEAGLIKSTGNAKMQVEKNQKLADMGLSDVESPILGESVVELTLHFVYHKEPGETQEQIYLYVEADDYRILMKKPLDEVIGKTSDDYWKFHYPYNTWADDLERQDFWSDGIADTVRTPNKILNSWMSQLVENRTLRNLGMHYYNNAIEGFTPQTYQPIAWGWYGVPVPPNGRITDMIQKVDVPELSESLDEMEYVVQMVEKATGATATSQGQVEQRQVTLGEIQLAIGEAKERIKGMSKFYTQVWKDRAEKFLKLIEASGDKLDAVKIYKKGLNSDNLYTRDVGPDDWRTKTGYTVRIWSQDQKNERDMRSLEKMNAVKANMPDNPKVDEVYKRHLLEFAEFTPQEVSDAMNFENKKREMMNATMIDPMTGRPMMNPGAGGGGPMMPPQNQPMLPAPQVKSQ